MRSCVALLMLFAILPVVDLLAAPAPDPYAILDIGPPPKGETAEQYRKNQSEGQTSYPYGTLCKWWTDPEVKKLPSVVRFKDARPWLARNLRVTPEEGLRRLRFTFRAGTRAEQVTILNALLRVNLAEAQEAIKCDEEWIRIHEKNILELKTRIKLTQNAQEIPSLRKGMDDLLTNVIPDFRANIVRRKQLAVVKWAR